MVIEQSTISYTEWRHGDRFYSTLRRLELEQLDGDMKQIFGAEDAENLVR